MTQDEAIIIMQETVGQLDEALKRLSTIPALEIFGEGIEQLDFAKSIHALRSARSGLEQAIEEASINGVLKAK